MTTDHEVGGSTPPGRAPPNETSRRGGGHAISLVEELDRSRIRWVIRLRSVVTVVLVGLAVVTAPTREVWQQVVPVAGLALVVFAANALWRFLLERRLLPNDRIALYQCLFDVFAISLAVYHFGTGGFTGFLYLIVIVVAGVLLPRDKTLYMAAAASAVYFLLLFMETYGYFRPVPPASPGEGLLEVQIPQAGILVNLGVKVFFFYLVALSIANLQDLLQRYTREADFLARFNKSIINAVPVGVMVLDLARRIVRINPAMCRATFLAKEDEALGKALDEVMPGAEEAWSDAFARVEESKEEVRLLGATVPLRGGADLRANIRLQPILEDGEVLGTVLSFQLAGRK